MLTVLNAPLPSLRSPEMVLTPLEAPSGTAKFDLSLFAAESDEGLHLTLEYSSDLFEPATVDRMMAHFRVLLEAVVARPEQPVGALPMLTEEESRQVLADWGGGGPEDGRDAVGIDDLPAGFDDADDAELDALLDQLSPGEPSNDE
jgi:non-ribosomal peptide synthetase component F